MVRSIRYHRYVFIFFPILQSFHSVIFSAYCNLANALKEKGQVQVIKLLPYYQLLVSCDSYLSCYIIPFTYILEQYYAIQCSLHY